MASFCQLTVVGNLTRDPALKFLPNQTPVVDGGIAINRKYKVAGGEEREEVVFLDYQCFGKAAEIINQYATKGSNILFSGRLKQDNWEDKNGGGKRSKLLMIVENFQFISNRQGNDGGQHETPAGVKRPTMGQALKDRAKNNPQAELSEDEGATIDCPF